MWNSMRLNVAIVCLAVMFGGGNGLAAQPDRQAISPARQINHPPNRLQRRPPRETVVSTRSLDGTGNNVAQSEMGAAHTPLLRLTRVGYVDGMAALAGPNRPSARTISNAVNAQAQSIPNPLGASDFLWQWGQFLDHDLDLTDGTDPAEFANIAVPSGDIWFDPEGTGEVVIPFNRSLYDPTTGTARNNPREQINEITAWD